MVEDLSYAPGSGLSLAHALARVPGYQPGMPVTALLGGSVNCSYRVSTPAGHFVVRLSRGPEAWLAPDRSVERALHSVVAAAGLAPAIIAADPRDAWLVTAWVEGRVWASDDFADLSRLSELGEVLKRLHGLSPPQIGRVNVLASLQGYVERVGAPVRLLLQAAEAWEVSGAAGRPLAILHHDLHGSNLLQTPQGLLLIDWECAAVSDPLLDVACVLSYQPEAQVYAAQLLQTAGLGGVAVRQLAAACWLFDLHTWLWYQERRRRLVLTAPERHAEELLAVRLEQTLPGWRPGR